MRSISFIVRRRQFAQKFIRTFQNISSDEFNIGEINLRGGNVEISFNFDYGAVNFEAWNIFDGRNFISLREDTNC